MANRPHGGALAQSRSRKLKVDSKEQHACGLCGKRTKLTRTECCGQWICDDEANYAPFSYSRTSCHRNHRRYTLCGYHHSEEHGGSWQTCEECRTAFKPELFVWNGTNEYNFEKLPNPPAFEPTRCDGCGEAFSLVLGGYSEGPAGLLCPQCSEKRFSGMRGR